MNRALLAALSLWKRELVHFYRQRNRVLGALGPPLFLWALIGSGMEGLVGGGAGPGYRTYFYPGIVALVVLFTAIFSAISLIEDRQNGYLLGVLAAPIPRWAIVLGKTLGGTSQGVLQGVLLLALAPLAGVPLRAGAALTALLGIVLIAFALTAFGFLAAWRSESVAAFHAVMSLILMPMWVLSGAVFPVDTAPQWMRWIMLVNPMRYGVHLLQSGLLETGGTAPLDWAVLLSFGAVAFGAGVVGVELVPAGDRLPPSSRQTTQGA